MLKEKLIPAMGSKIAGVPLLQISIELFDKGPKELWNKNEKIVMKISVHSKHITIPLLKKVIR